MSIIWFVSWYLYICYRRWKVARHYGDGFKLLGYRGLLSGYHHLEFHHHCRLYRCLLVGVLLVGLGLVVLDIYYYIQENKIL